MSVIYTDSPQNRARVLLLLSVAALQLTFRKANGDTRVLLGTRVEGKLPPTIAPLATVEELAAEDSCPVLDVDLNEWRSFRWDSLLEVSAPSVPEGF